MKVKTISPVIVRSDSGIKRYMPDSQYHGDLGTFSSATGRPAARKAKSSNTATTGAVTKEKSSSAVLQNIKDKYAAAKESGVLDTGKTILSDILSGKYKKTPEQEAALQSVEVPVEEEKKMSTAMTVGIVVGSLALLGGIIYLATRPKK